MANWPAELEARRGRVRAILADEGCEAGLVFGCDGHHQSFRYLTNFAPLLGDAWLLLADEPSCVMTFQWQIIEARERSGIERWQAAFDPLPLVLAAVRGSGARRIGLVGIERMPVVAHTALAALPGIELVDLGSRVAALRRRKSPLEVEALRRAARLTDGMLDAARAELRAGMTEAELAARVSTVALAAGGDCAFETCVVSGVDHPVPIRRPTDRRIAEGDSVMVDAGAELDGYQADATRTFVVGEPSARQQAVWDVIRRAHEVALEMCGPGVACRDIHLAAARVIADAGYELPHRIGHGIGLATSYEWPAMDSETAPLEPGVTICIEPGIYIPGAGNMKLEDDLVITPTGHELLTHGDRSL